MDMTPSMTETPGQAQRNASISAAQAPRGLRQLPRPPLPARCMVADPDSFAHWTLAERFPTIIQHVIADNQFPGDIAERLTAFGRDLAQGSVRRLHDDGPDLSAWHRYLTPFLGRRWSALPWYFAEAYFYRRLLEATQYFLPGPGSGVDPYRCRKAARLTATMDAVAAVSAEVTTGLSTAAGRRPFAGGALLWTLLSWALWSNWGDLSLWPIGGGAADPGNAAEKGGTQVLVDDSARVVERLEQLHGARVDIIADNAGLELVCDLALADVLLASGGAERVYLHLKAHPMFVSDATGVDVYDTVQRLTVHENGNVRHCGTRLDAHLRTGRLRLRPEFFWTSPRMFTELPPALRAALAQSSLVVVKGDANYRRLLGDRRWPVTTSFDALMGAFPALLVAIRTVKSELLVGLTAEQALTLGCANPQWVRGGRWGIIQCADRAQPTGAVRRVRPVGIPRTAVV